MNKPDPSLVPFDAIPVTDLPLRVEHIDLLLTSWWTHATNELQVALVPAWVLPVAAVFAHYRDVGKYPARDWETNPERWQASKHFAAFKRHFHANVELDAESGLPHWWHAISRAVMLATLHARGVLVDDRPPISAATQAKLAEFRAEMAERDLSLAGVARGGVSN